MTLSRANLLGGALAAAGATAVVGGLWMLWPPLAVVLLGLAVLGLGVMLVVEVD